MSTLVPSILPMHTPSSYPILSAFPVHFPAFPHKTNNTLSCPQRKKDKNSKGTLYCPVHSLSVYTKGPNILPQSASAHKRRNKRDNILSPLCTVYLRERDNIMSPSFLLRFPTYFTRGTIYCPFNIFPDIYLKGIIYCPLMHDSLKNGVIRGII